MTPTAVDSHTEAAAPSGSRAMGRGGHRLAEAFEAAGSLPALAETVVRVQELSRRDAGVGELADAAESDVAVVIAVLRAAGNGRGPQPTAGSLPDAVEALGAAEVGAVAGSLETYDLLSPASHWEWLPERFRRHAVTTRHAAERIADLADLPGRDQLATAALLHDIGKLVLVRLYPGYAEILNAEGLTPEQRVRRERHALGIDHTMVGGVLARRWGLPTMIAGAIERHHSPEPEGQAAAVRLADLVAHQAGGALVDGEAMLALAPRSGISAERLKRLLYEFPHARERRRRRSEPCPLSKREVDALRGLTEGKVYKQIAVELGLSASTVRTHLHNVYRKIGAADRAQAVLLAREKGWV